jgi:hypothetical protein
MKKYGLSLFLCLFLVSAAFAGSDVTYQLSNTPGTFSVSMTGDIPIGIHNLVIFSSSDKTTYSDIRGMEYPDEWELDVRPIYEGMPKINAFIDTPVAEGEVRNYDIKAEFSDDSCLFEDGGSLVFSRKTNFNHISVVVPEGYIVEEFAPEFMTVKMTEDGSTLIQGDNSSRAMVDLYIKFVEDGSLIPVYPDRKPSTGTPAKTLKSPTSK